MQRPGFFHGIAAFYAGVGFVATTPRLWLRAAMPIASLLAVGSGLGLGGVWLSVRAADHLAGGPGFLAESGHFLVALSLSLVAVAIAAVVGLTLAQPLSSSALDGLAQAQAEALHLPPWPVQSRGASLGRSLRSALVGLGAWLIATAVLGLVGLVIPGAAVVTAPLELLASALLVAWDLLDYPCGLAGLGMRERLRWMQAHPGATVGFGLVGASFALLPLVGLLVLPFGVAGATRLFTSSPPVGAPLPRPG